MMLRRGGVYSRPRPSVAKPDVGGLEGEIEDPNAEPGDSAYKKKTRCGHVHTFMCACRHAHAFMCADAVLTMVASDECVRMACVCAHACMYAGRGGARRAGHASGGGQSTVVPDD